MPLSILPTIIMSGVGTLTASGTTMLIVAPESDLARSAGVLGVIIAAVAAANAAHYSLVDRRLRRIETLSTRIVGCERAVLDALNEDGEPPGR